MSSSVSDGSSSKKVKKKMRKKSVVCDGRDSAVVVAEATGSRLKELLTRVLRDLLPKDSSTDLQSDERVAGEEDERTGGKEKKHRDRNNRQQGEMVRAVKKQFVLGVNEILTSITSHTASAVLLTDPLETHVQRQLCELAHHHSVPCLCVAGLHETLKSLRVPSTIGIAVRKPAVDSCSIVSPLLNCIREAAAAAGQSIDVPSHSPQSQPVRETVTSAIKFHELTAQQLYKSGQVLEQDDDDAFDSQNEENLIAVVVAEDNFFPRRRDAVTSSSPFVVSHQSTGSSDRDSALLTRFSFTQSNVDQSTRPSSSGTGDEGVVHDEEEKGVSLFPAYRKADSVTVQSSGKKRIRRKNTAKSNHYNNSHNNSSDKRRFRSGEFLCK